MGRLTLKACAFRFFDTFLLIVPFYTVMFSERGLTPAQIGLALAAWSAVGLALEIPSGLLADRVSRRWLLFVGQAIRSVGFLLWMLVPSFWGFLAGLMCWGVKSALQSGTFEALIYDELAALGRARDYARTIGRAQAARWAGFVGASLTAAAAVPLGYDLLLMASLAASVLSAVVALALPRAPKVERTARPHYLAHLRQGLTDARRLPGVLPLLLFIAGMHAVITACEDYWQLFGRGIGLATPQIALFVAALGATSAAAAMLAHRANAVPLRTLYILLAVAGLILVGAAWMFQPGSVLLLIPFMALARGLDVSLDARFQAAIRPETRATVASVKGFAAQCATTLLILGFGFLAQLSAYREAFMAYGAALVLLGAGYGAMSLRRGR